MVFHGVSIAYYGLIACAGVSCSICLDPTALFGSSERRSTLQPLRPSICQSRVADLHCIFRPLLIKRRIQDPGFRQTLTLAWASFNTVMICSSLCRGRVIGLLWPITAQVGQPMVKFSRRRTIKITNQGEVVGGFQWNRIENRH